MERRTILQERGPGPRLPDPSQGEPHRRQQNVLSHPDGSTEWKGPSNPQRHSLGPGIYRSASEYYEY